MRGGIKSWQESQRLDGVGKERADLTFAVCAGHEDVRVVDELRFARQRLMHRIKTKFDDAFILRKKARIKCVGFILVFVVFVNWRAGFVGIGGGCMCHDLVYVPKLCVFWV